MKLSNQSTGEPVPDNHRSSQESRGGAGNTSAAVLSTAPLDSELTHPAGGPSPHHLDFDGYEPSETAEPEQRFDRVPVKLETRGVTSHRPRVTQTLLFARELIWHSSIIAKLDGFQRPDLADSIRDCHSKKSVRQCTGCRKHSVFYNRCEVMWCPICAARLSRERKEAVEWWTKQIAQPKHVVLTVRNSETFTKDYVQSFKKAFSRLRRKKFARNWLGGFYSLEVTNESRGWHLHLHALIDARWIDSGQLSIEWGKCVGQDFGIVKVIDARNRDYLKEVTKYAVKGNELASWSAPDIEAFITAFDGCRTFGVFGSLYAKRTEWREWLDELHAGRIRCECGCDHWRIMSDDEFTWLDEIVPSLSSRPPPEIPTVPQQNPELF